MFEKVKGKKITLKRKDYEKIISHAKREYHLESCGLFGGEVKDGKIYITQVHELTNVDESSTHFSLDPKEQFEAVKEITDSGYEWIGSYHSHPITPCRPSEEDKRLAYDSYLIYAIVSFLQGEPELGFFEIDEDKKVRKYEYEIKEERGGADVKA